MPFRYVPGMRSRPLLLVFGIATFAAFAAWRLITTSVVEYGGTVAGLVLIAVVFAIGALAAPYLDR